MSGADVSVAKRRRSVLLTGATGGIGREVARRLVDQGHAVLLFARDADALAALAGSLRRRDGADVEAVAGDVCVAGARATLVRIAERRGVDTLINNAGVSGFGALEDLDDATIRRVIETNLVAPLQLTRAMLGPLSRAPKATILNVGSALGHVGVPGFALYGASKFGLRGATEALRRELADTGIRVTAVSPRATRTALNDDRASRFNAATGTASDDPDHVARAILRQLEGRGFDRVLGWPERLFARLNALVPRLVDTGFAAHRRALREIGAPSTAALADGGPPADLPRP
jgi:short-subunit dehydrogenase